MLYMVLAVYLTFVTENRYTAVLGRVVHPTGLGLVRLSHPLNITTR